MNGKFSLSLDVTVKVESWQEAMVQPKYIVARAAQAAFQAEATSIGRDSEAGVWLTDDAEIKALNRDYRDQDKSTNVLSFPALDDDDLVRLPASAPLILGDVIIALETMLMEAKAEAITPEDHLSHLVVHGMLHLLGHDHKTEYEATIMEQLEVDILKRLGIKDPYSSAKFSMALA